MSDQDSHRENLPYLPGNRTVGEMRGPFPTGTGQTFRGPGQHIDPMMGHERSLWDYVEVLLQRRWLVIAVLLAAVALATGYAFARIPVYTSVASIEVQGNKAKSKETMYGSPEHSEFQRYFLTQMQILQSRVLAEALVNRMNLEESEELAKPRPSFGTKVLGWLSSVAAGLWGDEADTTGANAELSRHEAIVDNLRRRVSVRPIKRSNLVRVSIDARNPETAQQLLRNYLSLFLKRGLENKRKESLEAAAWLKSEAEKAERKLREAQAALVTFTLDHGIVDSADGGLNQVLRMLNKTMEGHVRSREARVRIQAIRNRQSPESVDFLPDEMKNEHLTKLKEELALRESEYSEMRGVYSANYPMMRMLEKKIDFLRKRIAEVEKRVVTSALETARYQEELLKESYEKAREEADRVKSLEAQYSLLNSAVTTTSEFHKILLKEYKEMEIRARTISNDVRIVDPPSLPTKPSKPKKSLIILIGALMGLMAGVLGAFAAQALDRTVRKSDEIEQILDAKTLGVVPDGRKLSRAHTVPVEGNSYDFVAYDHPRSPMSDALRNIQASIFLTNFHRDIKSLAVSSAIPGEGKSLMTVSIVTVFASVSRKRVVIVDVDMRKPRIHQAFGLTEAGPGLSDLLDGNGLWVEDVIRNSRVGGLEFITAGSPVLDPVTALQSERLGSLLGELTRRFEHVVLDTPPILGFADTPIVCHHVDGLVMVVKQGHARRDEVSQALQIVRSVGRARVLGVVLNQVNSGVGFRYGSGYYYRTYRYYDRQSS